ncbi:MAG: cyclic nucleotide-binding domain-containing protein [Spirochaetes bacterium]|nr:cyclic nucleotide-binding domain-containing protein [Spirochaetota bacterium]
MIKLSKGGVLLDTTAGVIQVGAPPETIKDSMALNRDVPAIYIAPKNLFSHKKMASFFDIEFPCNFNFFIKKQKTTIICTESQKEIILKLIQESVFGPEVLNLEIEYVNGRKNFAFPDMRKEMEYFTYDSRLKRHFNVHDIVEFIVLYNHQPVDFSDISIELDMEQAKLFIHDRETSEIPWNLDYDDNEIEEMVLKSEEIFIPPSFGITTLGSSHGFDPKGKTSGYIFWINGVGIFVDPPIDSALWLMDENVDPKMVNSVILTHCHSDHDSGVMQKILQEGRITLYTTPTIFSSFLKKISLLTGLNEIDIVQLIDFVPITIGKPININGAKVVFEYRLHSIPTIGFEVHFKGTSVVCSSDHLNDLFYFNELYEKGVLTKGRYEKLSSFNWDRDIIIHEAGVPPLHTPIEVLLNLPAEYKRRIFLVHTDQSKIPPESGLRIAPTGLANTMVIDTEPTIHGESIQILNIVSYLDIFQEIPFYKAAEFLSIIKYLKFNPGDVLVQEGDINRRFFIIIAGKATLIERDKTKAILTSGSYFGESSLITGKPAEDSIIALTDLITISIDKSDFLDFISNTPILEKLKKLGKVRNQGSWGVIDSNDFFKTVTINQKNYLESLFVYEQVEKDHKVVQYNSALEYAIFWLDGDASLLDKNNKEITRLREGDYLGDPQHLLGETGLDYSLITHSTCHFFKVDWNEMLKFFQKNPGILLELRKREKDHYYHRKAV